MKLSELIAFKNELDKLSALPAQRSADGEINKITQMVESFPLTVPSVAALVQGRAEIEQKFAEFENQLNELKQTIKKEIATTEQPWFAESYRLYEQEMNNETFEDLIGRQTKLSAETEEFYRARLIRYTGWKHSAMIIRPGAEDYINIMVSCDPLYLVDTRHELLKPAITLYNETYQRRLRPYVISEQSDRKILGQLPDGQFGLVFAHNFFNFRPFEIMRQWLTEIYQKLKPGGMLLMTINDCDRYKAVISVENRFCCYTPGYLVLELAQSLGFEVEFTWNDDGPVSWLELKRPGELTSVRGGQSLAKIIPK